MSGIAAVPVVIMPVVFGAFASLVIFGAVRGTIPRYVYQDAFGERPSADVRHLWSRNWHFADEGHVFMRFEATGETFHRIASKRMQKVSFKEFEAKVPDNHISPPRWWVRPTESTGEIYLRAPEWGHGLQFASESEFMTYDPATNTVMYFFLGID